MYFSKHLKSFFIDSIRNCNRRNKSNNSSKEVLGNNTNKKR